MSSNKAEIKSPLLAFEIDLESSSMYRDNFYSKVDDHLLTTVDEIRIDLLSISNFVYAADKRVPRLSAKDGWTRELKLTISVLCLDLWKKSKEILEKMLSFLTGDIWTITFQSRNLTEKEVHLLNHSEEERDIPLDVCMFSGGLDSFIGAIDILTSPNTSTPLFISHYGGGSKGTKDYQEILKSNLMDKFDYLTEQSFVSFYSAAMKSLTKYDEATTRSRSFMFFSHAIALVPNGGRLIIPENGFVSLNIPLFDSRIGSSSTRTTHPFYMDLLRQMLEIVGIDILVENPYQFLTKGEMIQHCLDKNFLDQNIVNTMSCSHPVNGRWSHFKEPIHCGYCLPCTIRRASILSSDILDQTPYQFSRYQNKIGSETLNALRISIHRNRNTNPMSRVQYSGPLPRKLPQFARVYSVGMSEIENLVDGIENDELS
ncbi:hypothetical protein IGI66_001174 [Enterococcus sp. AZ048]|uniref:Qat anti-phage system QueC-like protein QatC n=1 Tax=Enterococcus sp. AZ048 TaxID=2774658 RepID=UPI003F225385